MTCVRPGSDRVTIRRKSLENEMADLGRWSWWGQVRFPRWGPFGVRCLLPCPRLDHGQVQKSNPLSLREDPHLCRDERESYTQICPQVTCGVWSLTKPQIGPEGLEDKQCISNHKALSPPQCSPSRSIFHDRQWSRWAGRGAGEPF